jgi:hypothetical protein
VFSCLLVSEALAVLSSNYRGPLSPSIIDDIAKVVQANKAFCDRHGCLPAPRLINQRPFGVDHIEQLLRAARECRLSETLTFYIRQSGNTLEHVLFGTSGFATIEPDNIEALLSSNKGMRITSCKSSVAAGADRFARL